MSCTRKKRLYNIIYYIIDYIRDIKLPTVTE